MDIEPTWLELLGTNNWQGLLDPLNLTLRTLILRCGDFCQATYDAFNNDPNSKYAGSSRYGKNSFFQNVMLESGSDYQIFCFLYATAKVDGAKALLLKSLSRDSWDRESNWIGYLAVTNDQVSQALGRREVYIVWRGTSRSYEWIDVLDAKAVSAKQLLRPEAGPHIDETVDKPPLPPPLGIGSSWLPSWLRQVTGSNSSDDNDDDDDDDTLPKVMQGWLTLYVSDDPKSSFTKLSARDQLQLKIQELREKYKNEDLSITFTGHSLGATLSILSAFDIVENGVTDIPVSAIVFGSPQVGNKAFNDRMNGFPNLKILHVRNKIDLIPLYPSILLGYVDSGIELEIDTRKSPNLKASTNTGDWHNLQGMLHTVAGWNGENGEFELKVKRSVALVNKSSAFLKDELLIPESWWIAKNKGMVFDHENGDWILIPPSEEDLPVPEY